MSLTSVLPPRSPITDTKDKEFRTALPLSQFSKFTQEALDRGGLTPYQLARVILLMYLNKEFLVFSELPADIQSSIKQYNAKNVSA